MVGAGGAIRSHNGSSVILGTPLIFPIVQIGGYDRDVNYMPTRTVANLEAIKRACQGGMLLGANGGLRAIPIYDNGAADDSREYHHSFFHLALRERVRKANGGRSDHIVLWRNVSGSAGEQMLEKWMIAYKSSPSHEPQLASVLRAKPAGVTDGCYDRSTPPQFIAEDLTFSRKPDSKCGALHPVYANPRLVAGAPLALDILKCQLRPVNMSDYTVIFTPAERARLTEIFPGGVCDWSKPGVNQVPVVTWASFGPSPKNLVVQPGEVDGRLAWMVRSKVESQVML